MTNTTAIDKEAINLLSRANKEQLEIAGRYLKAVIKMNESKSEAAEEANQKLISRVRENETISKEEMLGYLELIENGLGK